MDGKNTLVHYGVPGMKWGVRKKRYDDPEDDKRKRRAAKADDPEEEPHEDYKRTVAKKSLKAMSTKEIQEMNTRIQAENLNRNLTMTRSERAMEWFKKTMIDVGKQSVRRFIDHYANAGVDRLTGAIDEKTKVGDLFGTKKKNDNNNNNNNDSNSNSTKGKYSADEIKDGVKYAVNTAKDINAKAEADNPTVQKNKQEFKDSVSRAVTVAKSQASKNSDNSDTEFNYGSKYNSYLKKKRKKK